MKKNVILIFLIIIIFILDSFLFYNYIFLKYKAKNSLEKNEIIIAENLSNTPFKVSKIILYSSASAENKNTNFQNTNWILDIYQYTDIAIFIDSLAAIKNLSITNPKFNNTSQKLYYLDSNNFGSGDIDYNFEITNTLDFSILNFSNTDNSIKYNTPVFFANASNPITLKFTNTLFKNFSIDSKEKLAFNGSLLSKTPIKLEQLFSNFSFCINITDYNNQHYSTILDIEIPVQNESSNIFNGYIYSEKLLNMPLF